MSRVASQNNRISEDIHKMYLQADKDLLEDSRGVASAKHALVPVLRAILVPCYRRSGQAAVFIFRRAVLMREWVADFQKR